MRATIEDKQLVLKDKSTINGWRLTIRPESKYDVYLLSEWKNSLRMDSSINNTKLNIETEIK